MGAERGKVVSSILAPDKQVSYIWLANEGKYAYYMRQQHAENEIHLQSESKCVASQNCSLQLILRFPLHKHKLKPVEMIYLENRNKNNSVLWKLCFRRLFSKLSWRMNPLFFSRDHLINKICSYSLNESYGAPTLLWKHTQLLKIWESMVKISKKKV